MVRAFQYLRDPVFLGALALFALNSLWLRDAIPSPFLRHHFNDLLLIPCALPPLLRIHACLGLRRAADFPSMPEIAGHLLVWSLLFEIAGPRLTAHATGDALDILYYWSGGAVAWALWNLNPRNQTETNPA
jgi:hypothetical protein